MKKLMSVALVIATALVTATAMDAKVISTKGKAEVQSGGTWKALAVGDTLKKGAVIQTGFKSELVLQIKESIVTVAPLSHLTIEQLAEKETKDETRLYLDTGSLKSNVKKAENRRVGFTVKSPVATASVRGTELGVSIGYQSADFETYSGSVAVWKESNWAPAVATDAEDAAPEATAMNGQTAQDISGGEAQRGAFTVNAGQTAGFAENGPTSMPQDNAARMASDIGNGTNRRAANEAIALGGPAGGQQPGGQGAFLGGTKPEASSGSASITFTLPSQD